MKNKMNNILIVFISMLFIIICAIIVFITSSSTNNTYIKTYESIKTTNYLTGEYTEPAGSSEETIFSEEMITTTIPEIVNINTAGIDELVTLSGVGEVIAQRIIDHKNENGAFYNIEEIMTVSGIGEKIFEKIKNRITV